MFRKSHTRDFSAPVWPANLIHPVSRIRANKFLTKPKRHCETATVGRSFGPNGKPKEALLQGHLGQMTLQSRMEKPLLRGLGGLLVDWKLKKGSTCMLPWLMQRYNQNGRIANRLRKDLTTAEAIRCHCLVASCSHALSPDSAGYASCMNTHAYPAPHIRTIKNAPQLSTSYGANFMFN